MTISKNFFTREKMLTKTSIKFGRSTFKILECVLRKKKNVFVSTILQIREKGSQKLLDKYFDKKITWSA